MLTMINLFMLEFYHAGFGGKQQFDRDIAKPALNFIITLIKLP